jgi:hypothetical protein
VPRPRWRSVTIVVGLVELLSTLPVTPAPPALPVPADDGTRLPAPTTPLLVLLGQNPSGQRVTLLHPGA